MHFYPKFAVALWAAIPLTMSFNMSSSTISDFPPKVVKQPAVKVPEFSKLAQEITPRVQSYLATPGSAANASFGLWFNGFGNDMASATSFAPLNSQGLQVTLGSLENTSAKPGSYRLLILPPSADNRRLGAITIEANDRAGQFYALQSLRQLYAKALENNYLLPTGEITDAPDIARRGVVEGFYGTPWSHETRLEILDYMGKHKLNTYIFGPKDDPYHSTPHWREPYPADEAAKIAELAKKARENSIDFVWAIHPGRDIRWNDADRDSLVMKFNAMYDLGVRGFAIFFDDISGIGTDPNRQAELLNYLTDNFVKPKGDVADLIVCPTDYSRLWANPKPNGALATYGNKLNPSVGVFYTGDFVCSDLTHDTMAFVNGLIKRPAFYWWNFPVSDYCLNYLLLGPSYGLDTSMRPEEIGGFVSNPMEYGVASLPALAGVADYCWNIARYHPDRAWRGAIEELVPGAADEYLLFATHNADCGKGYRREESWLTDTSAEALSTPEGVEKLAAEFRDISAAATKLQAAAPERLLREINPWLVQFANLGRRGTIACQILSSDSTPETKWALASQLIQSPEEASAYARHSTGKLKLNPFIKTTRNAAAAEAFEQLTGTPAFTPVLFTSYKSGYHPSEAEAMLDQNPETYYHSGTGQKAGDFTALDLGKVRDIESVTILQGRTPQEKDDFYDNPEVKISNDGKKWRTIEATLNGPLEITVDKPLKARYIGLFRGESKRTNWVAIREFSVAPKRTGRLAALPLAATDANPLTFWQVPGEVILPANATVLLSNIAPEAKMILSNSKTPSQSAIFPLVEEVVKLSPEQLKIYDTLTLRGNFRLHEAAVTQKAEAKK